MQSFTLRIPRKGPGEHHTNLIDVDENEAILAGERKLYTQQDDSDFSMFANNERERLSADQKTIGAIAKTEHPFPQMR